MTSYIVAAIGIFFVMSRFGPRAAKKVFDVDEEEDEEANFADDLNLRTEDYLDKVSQQMQSKEQEFTKKLNDLMAQTSSLTKDHEKLKNVFANAGDDDG